MRTNFRLDSSFGFTLSFGILVSVCPLLTLPTIANANPPDLRDNKIVDEAAPSNQTHGLNFAMPNEQVVAIGPFSSDQSEQEPGSEQAGSMKKDSEPLSLDTTNTATTHDADYFAERAYGIGGPWRLRSADALKPGTLSIRNEFNWSTGYRSGDDEAAYSVSIDYGIAPMHHLTLETTSIDLGDGGTTGNGDVRFGWHWQLLKEDDWKPSFALRNYIRVPTGYESSGVDYELRGLFSKSVADHVRIHVAPFLKSVNGDNIEDVRYFQWGAAIGSDWKISDKLDLVVDYVHETSQTEGLRNQHSLDAGFIYEIAKGHKIGVNGRVGLDGDGVNGDWGAGVFYTIALDGLPSLAK